MPSENCVMSTDDPQVGEVSADGAFRWDGSEWAPLARGQREPTSWTLPLRRTVAAYLVLVALFDVVSNGIVVTMSSLEGALRSSAAGLSADEVQAQAAVAFALGWVSVGVVAAVYVLLAAGSFVGWRWAFWADMAVLALRGLTAVTSALALSRPAPTPTWLSGLDLVIALVAAALLVWLVVAAVRFGPWAMRRPGGRLSGP
jgi:hypothetical protein